MTSWSLEPMDITKCWVSSSFDALPGLYWSSLQLLLVWGSFCSNFCLEQVKRILGWVGIGDWLDCCRIFHFFAGLLLQYVLHHCPSVLWSPVESTLLNRSRKYIPKLFTPLLSFVAPINTSDPVPLETITLPPPCFTEDVVFQFFSKCCSSRNSDRGWS